MRFNLSPQKRGELKLDRAHLFSFSPSFTGRRPG
jgi:hypothetical protein